MVGHVGWAVVGRPHIARCRLYQRRCHRVHLSEGMGHGRGPCLRLLICLFRSSYAHHPDGNDVGNVSDVAAGSAHAAPLTSAD